MNVDYEFPSPYGEDKGFIVTNSICSQEEQCFRPLTGKIKVLLTFCK